MNEPNEDFKKRFNKALTIRNIRPADLAEKSGLSKSTISHYMSGYTKPKSDKLFILAKALNVSETWLIGYDVPMERNNYEDSRLIERDAKLSEIEKILENQGHTLVCDNYDDDCFLIKNSFGQTIASFYDYELLSRYDSLKKKGNISIKLLLSSELAFFKYLESLGYYIGKDGCEHKPFIYYGNGAVQISPSQLDDIRTRINTYTKANLDTVILKLHEDELRQKRLEKEKTIKQLQSSKFETNRKTYLEPVAAHERTDIEVTNEMKQHDDDIMDNDEFWK